MEVGRKESEAAALFLLLSNMEHGQQKGRVIKVQDERWRRCTLKKREKQGEDIATVQYQKGKKKMAIYEVN